MACCLLYAILVAIGAIRIIRTETMTTNSMTVTTQTTHGVLGSDHSSATTALSQTQYHSVSSKSPHMESTETPVDTTIGSRTATVVSPSATRINAYETTQLLTTPSGPKNTDNIGSVSDSQTETSVMVDLTSANPTSKLISTPDNTVLQVTTAGFTQAVSTGSVSSTAPILTSAIEVTTAREESLTTMSSVSLTYSTNAISTGYSSNVISTGYSSNVTSTGYSSHTVSTAVSNETVLTTTMEPSAESTLNATDLTEEAHYNVTQLYEASTEKENFTSYSSNVYMYSSTETPYNTSGTVSDIHNITTGDSNDTTSDAIYSGMNFTHVTNERWIDYNSSVGYNISTDNASIPWDLNEQITKSPETDTTYGRTKATTTLPKPIITVVYEPEITKPSEKPTYEHKEPRTESGDELEVVTVTVTVPETTWSPPLFVTFILKSSWAEFCDETSQNDFRVTVSKLMDRIDDEEEGKQNGELEENIDMTVKPEQVVLHSALGCSPDASGVKYRHKRAENGNIPVGVYLDDHKGHYSLPLTKALADLLHNDEGEDMFKDTYLEDMVVDIKFHGTKYNDQLVDDNHGDSWKPHVGILVGIVIGSLAAVILLTLLVMQLVITRKRKRVKKMRHSYENRYSIDTLQGLGVDNIQLTGVRKTANHWGYVNPALIIDDRDFSSNPLNFNALCNIVKTQDLIEEEFMMLPNYIARVTDIPLGAEDKNRYANIIPVPESRVLLYPDHSKDNCFNYINANYVRGYLCAPKSYIATQAPLDNTREDFWHMVYEQKAQAILMLTALGEHGSPRCSEYWPNTDGGDTQRQFGQYEVVLVKRDIKREWITSKLRVRKIHTDQHLDVYHFWLTSWPAQGLPDPKTVIGFLLEARHFMELSIGPTVVHCSPGTGRTGVMISIDVQMMSYDDSKLIDILSCVSGMRQDRAGLVQTRDQYKFIYKALMEYAQTLHSTSRDPSRASSHGSLHVPDVVHS